MLPKTIVESSTLDEILSENVLMSGRHLSQTGFVGLSLTQV